jgi:hypothetical protein
MRILSRMRWWLSFGICTLVVLSLTAAPVLADTGTYRITDYHVRLEPQNDGTIRITITQNWVVNSGNIPWITVGLPNSHFAIEGKSDAANKVTADNSGGFTGVRIDLDKTYLAGQTFRVQFTVLQSNMLERLPEQNQWRIAYTPGWYDNAVIDHMQVDMVSPVDVGSYSSLVPQPNSTTNNILIWEKPSLMPGAHFTILIESPNGSFLIMPNKTIGGSSMPTSIIILLVVIGVIVMLSIWAAIRAKQKRDEANTILIEETAKQMVEDPKKKEKIEKGFEDYVDKKGIVPDAQGRYFDRGYGDYITPVIWAALLMRNNSSQRPPGTTGFIGTGHSCACACVSCACACACACAGGGAAGCTKKGFHECAECTEAANLPPNKV